VADGKGGYAFAGKVGTGFSSKMRADLKKQLSGDETDASPARDAPRMRDAHWVKPRLAAQVRFTEWTSDGKLRHPAFQGLRADKKPEECLREKPAPAASTRKPQAVVQLSNPGRLLFPKDKITKADLAAYYEAVAPAILRALRERP